MGAYIHMKLNKSSYYYEKSAMTAAEKFADVRLKIRDIFEYNRSV